MENINPYFDSVQYIYTEEPGLSSNPCKPPLPEDLFFGGWEHSRRQFAAERHLEVDAALYDRALDAHAIMCKVVRFFGGSAYILADRELGFAKVRLTDTEGILLDGPKDWDILSSALACARRRSFEADPVHGLTLELTFDLFSFPKEEIVNFL